jgi:cytidylate kinase
MNKINIAIDGYSACGKSSTAKAVAKALHYIYIDSGAMYRVVTYYFLKNDINIENSDSVIAALRDIHIHFESNDKGWTTYLNNENVEDKIRTLEVSEAVSPVSAISPVRNKLVTLQQSLGENKGVVMDGRDIGTVVFPDAELKIFMTADLDTRTLRRKLEMAQKGLEGNVEDIAKNLIQRDRIDTTRADSPLVMAEDAILLDTTNLDFDSQVEIIVNKAKQIINLSAVIV